MSSDHLGFCYTSPNYLLPFLIFYVEPHENFLSLDLKYIHQITNAKIASILTVIYMLHYFTYVNWYPWFLLQIHLITVPIYPYVLIWYNSNYSLWNVYHTTKILLFSAAISLIFTITNWTQKILTLQKCRIDPNASLFSPLSIPLFLHQCISVFTTYIARIFSQLKSPP